MTRLTFVRIVLPGALSAALALAGCGGSSTLGQADFLKRADAICREGQSSFQSIQSKPPNSAKEAADQTARLISVSEGELRRLQGLKAPDSARSSFTAYLDARSEAIDVLRKGEAAARRNDPQGYASAKQEIASGQPRRFDLARKAGLTVCSRPEVRAAGSHAR